MSKEEKGFKLNLSQIRKDSNTDNEPSNTLEEEIIIVEDDSSKEELLIKEDDISNEIKEDTSTPKLDLSSLKEKKSDDENANDVSNPDDNIIDLEEKPDDKNASDLKESASDDENANDVSNPDDNIIDLEEKPDDENASDVSSINDTTVDLEEALIIKKTTISIKENKIEEKGEEEIEEGTTPKLNLNAIKKEEVKEKVKEEIKKEVKEDKKENKKLFSTYKSDFTKKETSILEKIKKLKSLPKTRKGLLLIIILMAASIIGGLFIFVPNKHNLEVYKYGVTKIIGQLTGNPVAVPEIKTPEKINPSENNKKEEKNIEKINEKENIEKELIINIDEKTIKKHGITINYETEEVDGKEMINYNGAVYDSLEAFKKDLEKEIDRIKKERLAEFFKK